MFAVIKPGLIIHAGGSRIDPMKELYPGWDIVKVDQTSNENLEKWDYRKSEVKAGDGNIFFSFHDDKYWSPEFINLLDNWATEWMPYSVETFFDLNCLVVDEENVIFSNYNKELFPSHDPFPLMSHVIQCMPPSQKYLCLNLETWQLTLYFLRVENNSLL